MPLMNGCDFRSHRFHSSSRNHVSKVLHLRLHKETFRQFQNKMIVKQHLKSSFQMAQVSLERRTVYEDIVEEDDDEVAEIRSKKQVHGGLEGRRCVAQPKQQYVKLVMDVVGSESNLGDISIMHPNLMVTL